MKASTKKPAATKAPASKLPRPVAKSAATTKPHAATSTSAHPPSAKPAPAADAPPPMTPKTPKPAAAAAVPQTPKTPKPPQTPKAPQTPKTPKPPQTPKAPKPAAGKAPAKAATSRPATAKAAPAKPAASTAPAKSASAKTGIAKPASAKAAAKPASAKAAASKPASAKPATDAHAANGVATHDTTAHANGTAPATSPRAPGNKTPRGDKPAGAAPPARPATTATAKAPAKPAASGLKRPSTSTAASAKGKKATTPRGTTLDTAAANAASKGQKATTPRDGHSTGLPKKSPRSPRHPDGALKSPRHNVAGISRTHTAPELPIPADLRPSTITAGSRSVSVGGLQSNITRAAPTGRRKPTTNPLKNRPNSSPMPTREQSSGGNRAAAGFFSGMGILAAVGNPGADGLAELNGIQLRKVSEDKPKVLLVHVKGRRNVTARVTETTHKSLNKGDAFVLIDPSTRRIFEWRGSLANRMEIAKAMDLAGRIKNKEFSGRAEMFVLEEGKNDHHAGFWELLGGKGTVAPAEAVGEDEDEDKQVRPDFLYGVVEKVAGKPELSVMGKHKLSKDLIQTGQVYLVDCLTELYMWVGKGCSNTHRTFVASKAQEHLTTVKGRPKWVVITRVIEGAEPEIFKEKFTDWPSTLPITMAAIPKGNVAAKVNVKFDVNKMFTPAVRVDKVVDDGSGKVEIWRVKDHTKEPVDREMYGQFFDSESYVILYTYMQKNREMYIIYFWQGKKSSINEKGSSALLTVDLDDSIGGAAVQVRVVQNKEPKHFMNLFKGRIIVHKAYETEDGASAVPETALYQIRGFNVVDGACDVRAVQLISPSAKYLNTNDIFLLNTPEKQYIWCGIASSKFYQLSEAKLAELGSSIKASREQIFIREGEEPGDFWENVGEAEYYKTEWRWFPRLFHCSSASGSFQVEEVLEWDQEDLDPGHLNILDTSQEVYLWTGQRAVNLEDEKKQSMETVLEYTKLHPLRKEMGVVSDVLFVNGRREPFAFKCVFTAWDDSKTLDPSGLNDSIKVEDILKDLSRTYTLAELRNPPKLLDSSKLETYLSDEEFQGVFKMDKPTFSAQPLWKQEQQKKNVGLY